MNLVKTTPIPLELFHMATICQKLFQNVSIGEKLLQNVTKRVKMWLQVKLKSAYIHFLSDNKTKMKGLVYWCTTGTDKSPPKLGLWFIVEIRPYAGKHKAEFSKVLKAQPKSLTSCSKETKVVHRMNGLGWSERKWMNPNGMCTEDPFPSFCTGLS